MECTMLLGDDSSSFWTNVDKGGPVLATVVVLAVLAFIAGRYFIIPVVQLIAQTAADFRVAAETHHESQREHRDKMAILKDHEAMFGSKLRQADDVIRDARVLLDPFRPKSGTHSAENPTR